MIGLARGALIGAAATSLAMNFSTWPTIVGMCADGDIGDVALLVALAAVMGAALGAMVVALAELSVRVWRWSR